MKALLWGVLNGIAIACVFAWLMVIWVAVSP